MTKPTPSGRPAPSQNGLLNTAASRGVETHWQDATGTDRVISHETARALLDVLGPPAAEEAVPPVVVVAHGSGMNVTSDVEFVLERCLLDARIRGASWSGTPTDPLPVGRHRLTWRQGDGAEGIVTVLVTPASAIAPLRRDSVSVFVPTYPLRGDRPAPVGGLPELDAMASGLAELGVDSVATLPLYATFSAGAIFDPSPYSPVSRQHWNELFADLRHLPGPDGQPALTEELAAIMSSLRSSSTIDWRAANRTVTAVLDRALSVEVFRAEVVAWARDQKELLSYARFRSFVEAHGCPPDLGADLDSADAIEHDQAALRHLLGQQLMEEQMRALTTSLHERGQSFSLDLPVGSHPHGWEAWYHAADFATGVSVGAPPDDFFTSGQNWGFPPLHPNRSRSNGHQVWHETIDRASTFSGVVRIDHVMAVHRLWWIPDGAAADEGAYVHYRDRELWADVLITSHLRDTLIVGEDLGTVPPSVKRARVEREVLGMHEEQFVAGGPTDDGLPVIPNDVVAGIRTHDMMTFRSFLTGHDLELRDELGLPRPDVYADRLAHIEAWRRRLEAVLGHDVGDTPDELLAAALERLARSDAPVVAVDLDDLRLRDEPHNIPGDSTYALTWKRNDDQSLDAVLADPFVRSMLEQLVAWRREGGSD